MIQCAFFIHTDPYIMKDNRKYHFIRLNSGFIQEKSRFPIHVSKVNKIYAIISLPKPEEMLPLPIPTIQLLEVDGKAQHHLSFYAKESKLNPTKSQYHFTAYFSKGNSQNRDYELHVHFDENDQLTTAPILSELQADGTYFPISLSKLGPGAQEMLTSFALAHSHETIASLRLCIQEKIKQDIETYAKKSIVVDELSKEKDANPEPYFEVIQENIRFLNKIIPYHGREGYFARVCKILTDYANWLGIPLDQQNPPLAYEHKSSPDSDHSFSDTDETEEIPEVTLHTTQETQDAHDTDASSTPLNIDVSTLVKEAEKAMLEFQNKALTSTLKIRVSLLAKAITLTQEVYIFASDKALIQDPFDLVILQRLLLAQQQKKEKLLFHLIINCQLDEAKVLLGNSKKAGSLIGFECDYQAISYALKTGKSEILEFILERTDFPINTFTIPTPKGNVSAAMFCFLNDSAASPKAECLRVLVKHGASLMEFCPSTGLPLAHLLLSSEKRHPCMLALEDKINIQKTLLNPSFYIQLVCVLKKKAVSKDLNESIKLYKELTEQLSQNKNKHSAIEKKSMGDNLLAALHLNESLEKQQKPNLILIQLDPAYKTKNELLQLYRNQLNLSSQAQRNARKANRDNWSESCSSPETLSLLDASYSTFRKKVLEMLQEEIEELKIQVELNQLAKKMEGGLAFCTGKDAGCANRMLETQRREKKEERQQLKAKSRGLEKVVRNIDDLSKALNFLGSTLESMQKAAQSLSQCTEQNSEVLQNSGTLLENINVLSAGCNVIASLPAPTLPEEGVRSRDDDDRFGVGLK